MCEAFRMLGASFLPCPPYGVTSVHSLFVCSLLVRVRPQTRPAEYAKYPINDHTLLNKINKLAIRAGVPAPYKDTTRPAPGVTQDMFQGVFLSAPTSAMRALAEAGEQEVRGCIGLWQSLSLVHACGTDLKTGRKPLPSLVLHRGFFNHTLLD